MSRVAAFSGLLLFLCGLCTAAITAWLIIISYSPTPFGDQWGPLSDLASGQHWYSLKWLWQQHTEHRIFLYRLSLIADLRLFGGRAVSLFTLIYLTLLLHWIMWARFLQKSTTLPKWLWMSVAGFFAFCIFNPSQNENLYWAFQWTFIAAFAFASASFVALVWFSTTARPWQGVLFASIGAFLSEACLANGTLAWPVLWLATLVLPMKRWPRRILVLVGVGGMTLYLYHYRSPSYHANPLLTIRQPGRVGKYLLVYFGHCLTTYVTFPGFAAVILTIMAIVALWSLFHKSHTKTLAMALAMTMCFLFGTGVITALGRLTFGVEQATASRYQSSVMLYWACVFTALFVAAWEKRSWRDIVTINLIGLCLVLLTVPELHPISERLRERAQRFASIGESLDGGAVDPSLQPDLIIGRGPIESSTLYLHRLGETIGPKPVHLRNDLLKATPLDRSACEGVFDGVGPLTRYYPGPREVRADGWAIDLHTHRPAKLIAITDQNGSVLAVNALHFPRPDVLAVLHGEYGSVGWRLYVPLSQNANALHAFAIVDQHACPIGVFHIPVLAK
ncbi:MAG: hypothetical protein M3Y27_20585 [Acidobacteriota bacterium]|nr:hypothetical protein [Acidobacteriota bacterium]